MNRRNVEASKSRERVNEEVSHSEDVLAFIFVINEMRNDVCNIWT